MPCVTPYDITGSLRGREIAVALKRRAWTGLDFSRVCTLLYLASGLLISSSVTAREVLAPVCVQAIQECFDFCSRTHPSSKGLAGGLRFECYTDCFQKSGTCYCQHEGKAYCSGDSCTNLQNDNKNCGACGVSCACCNGSCCTCEQLGNC